MLKTQKVRNTLIAFLLTFDNEDFFFVFCIEVRVRNLEKKKEKTK